MARAGSTTSNRTTRKTAAQKAAEAEELANQTPALEADENTELSTEATLAEVNTGQEAPVSTDTIDEVKVDETDASVNTESADKPAENKPVEIDLSDFKAAVGVVLDEQDPGYDTATGDVPADKVEAVKAAYRELPGAKAKNQAKDYLTDALREAIGALNVVRGAAVMQLNDAVKNAGSASKSGGGERKPADPKAAFVERLTALHLAYALVRDDLPEGIEGDEVYPLVDAKVDELAGQADALFAYVNSTAEDKGDAPESDPIVQAAIKVAQGKAARTKSTSGATRSTSSAERRNVRTHIGQVFADSPSGTFMKVSEIAKAVTAEYPDGACSPGAVTAALKSDKGVEGFELVTGDGPAGARKL